MNFVDSILSAYGGIYFGLLNIGLFFVASIILIYLGGGKDE